MEPIFRRAEPEDADAILTLYHKCVKQGKLDGSSEWDEEYPNRDTIAFDLSNGGLYVMEENAKITAAISMMEHDDLDELQGWTQIRSCALARLCTDPQKRGRGLARSMINAIQETAKKLGYQATRHLSACGNQKSTDLYEKMGFRKIGKAYLYETDFWMFEMLL